MLAYAVWHIHHMNLAADESHLGPEGNVDFDECRDDMKLIGIYSSERLAKEAISRTQVRRGFSEEPRCFLVQEHVVDEDNWTDGFVTV